MNIVLILLIAWLYLCMFCATFMYLGTTSYKSDDMLSRSQRLRLLLASLLWFVFWPWVMIGAYIDSRSARRG